MREYIMKRSIEVSCELANFGRDECGYPYSGEVYFLLATFADGSRLRHNHRFYGVEVYDTEEGTGFSDIREEALAEAEALCAKVNASTKELSFDHWSFSEPAYGSRAYSESDTLDWERRKEEDMFA